MGGGRGTTILPFYVGDGGGDDEEQEVVSEVNILASVVSKLSAGTTIFRSP